MIAITSEDQIRQNDAKYIRVVDANTIILDFRNFKNTEQSQSRQAHAVANRHFNNQFDIFKPFNGHVYHVKSVSNGLWACSLVELTEDQTSTFAKPIVDSNPQM